MNQRICMNINDENEAAYKIIALKAFDVNAVDYLLKPYDDDRFFASLEKAKRHIDMHLNNKLTGKMMGLIREHMHAKSEYTEVFTIREKGREHKVNVADIVFLRAEQKYVTLRTKARSHLIEESLIALEREFEKRFVRIHRNCLVAREAIRGFERAAPSNDEPHWMVVLDGIEERLPVSRRQWPMLRELVEDRNLK